VGSLKKKKGLKIDPKPNEYNMKLKQVSTKIKSEKIKEFLNTYNKTGAV